THRFCLEEAPAAYRTILDPASGSLAVLLRYPETERPASVPHVRPRRTVEVSAPRAHQGNELRLAVAGAGNVARWAHLPALRAIPEVTLRAVFSANGARGKSYARRFGAAYCCSDYEEILRDSEVDVVLILSRNQHHYRQALAALQAGKHVFVEKPMALTENECRSLSRTVQETGRQLTVGFNRRFAPFYIEQKRALAGRAAPAVLDCRINSPGISGSYWMADPATGGAILGEACHFVDLMYWLLESEPVAVSAFSLPTGKKDPIGENNLVAAFRFADGSVGNLTYCTVGSRTSGGERVEAFAPGLGASAEDFKRVTVRTSVARKTITWFAEKGYEAQMRSFFAALKRSQPPAVTVRDGARATVACLRMLESARTLAPCSIDLDGVLAT